MISRRNKSWRQTRLPLLLALTGALLLLSLCGYGCKSNAHTTDSRLQKIDEMLNSQFPPSAPRSRIEFFLNSRGYKIEQHDKNSLVAIVRHVDTDTLQPETARVTFHFDPNDKLLSYELQAAPDAPLQP